MLGVDCCFRDLPQVTNEARTDPHKPTGEFSTRMDERAKWDSKKKKCKHCSLTQDGRNGMQKGGSMERKKKTKGNKKPQSVPHTTVMIW